MVSILQHAVQTQPVLNMGTCINCVGTESFIELYNLFAVL